MDSLLMDSATRHLYKNTATTKPTFSASSFAKTKQQQQKTQQKSTEETDGKKSSPLLNNFLNKYRTSDGGTFTHTNIGFPKGSFNVPVEEMPCLWDLVEH